MNLKLGMQHWGFKIYKVCINCDPGLIITYFTARSHLTFSIEKKVTTVDCSDTISLNIFYSLNNK